VKGQDYCLANVYFQLKGYQSLIFVLHPSFSTHTVLFSHFPLLHFPPRLSIISHFSASYFAFSASPKISVFSIQPPWPSWKEMLYTLELNGFCFSVSTPRISFSLPLAADLASWVIWVQLWKRISLIFSRSVTIKENFAKKLNLSYSALDLLWTKNIQFFIAALMCTWRCSVIALSVNG